MTYFLKHGSIFTVSTKAAMDLHEQLPVGTYTIKFNQMAGEFYLETIENFEQHGKVYGDAGKNAQRILNTFSQRPNATGVMLSGEKGSGKTMLAKLVAVEGRKADMPTIVINNPWAGETFNEFIQKIEQPVIIIFDEFEKVYSEKEDQEKLLTLLDGVYPSKKLFIITCNDQYRVNEHMKNRPGRIYYRLEYHGLDDAFIREYATDNLEAVEQTDALCRAALLFSSFNFDMLKAIVEEMNRYGETPMDAMKMLNTKPENDGSATYEVTLSVNGKRLEEDDLYRPRWAGNPLVAVHGIKIEYKNGGKDEDGDETYDVASFRTSDIQKIETKSGEFSFSNAKGETLTLLKEKPKTPEYYNLMV